MVNERFFSVYLKHHSDKLLLTFSSSCCCWGYSLGLFFVCLPEGIGRSKENGGYLRLAMQTVLEIAKPRWWMMIQTWMAIASR